MMPDYVLDTNIFILLFNNQLDEVIPQGRLGFSVITEIELLSFSGLSDADEKLIQQHLQTLARISLDQAVSQQTIVLRRQHRLKTPDAIVVASALVADAVLITNDQQLLGLDGVKIRALKMQRVG
ncbi:type II toxin-antitoxin system VapC family toxin [Leptothoe sp. EHU-05/26/07-4]